RLAAYELRPYELARRFPPDLVIRLDVDVDTASQRRPEDGRDYLEHRIGLVRALSFAGSLFGAVDIDATQPPDTVLTAILRTSWWCATRSGWPVPAPGCTCSTRVRSRNGGRRRYVPIPTGCCGGPRRTRHRTPIWWSGWMRRPTCWSLVSRAGAPARVVWR